MELIRQISLDCTERGQFLKKIWDSYIGLLETALIESQKISEQNEKSAVEEMKRVHEMYGQEVEHLKIEINLLNQEREENLKLFEASKHESRIYKSKMKKLMKDLQSLNKENQELKKENELLVQRALDGHLENLDFDRNNEKASTSLKSKKKIENGAILAQQRDDWHAGKSSVVSHLLFLKYGSDKGTPDELNKNINNFEEEKDGKLAIQPQTLNSPMLIGAREGDESNKLSENVESNVGSPLNSLIKMTRFDENLIYLNEGEDEVGGNEENDNIEDIGQRGSVLGEKLLYFSIFFFCLINKD